MWRNATVLRFRVPRRLAFILQAAENTGRTKSVSFISFVSIVSFRVASLVCQAIASLCGATEVWKAQAAQPAGFAPFAPSRPHVRSAKARRAQWEIRVVRTNPPSPLPERGESRCSLANSERTRGSMLSRCSVMSAAFALAASATLFGQATTTVSDTFVGPDGAPVRLRMTVTPTSTFTSPEGLVVPVFSTTTVNTNGSFTIKLVPNTGTTPAGSSYRPMPSSTGGTGWRRGGRRPGSGRGGIP